jgi:hypothetical protein
MALLDTFVRLEGDVLPPSAGDDAIRLNAAVEGLRSKLRTLPDEPAPADVWHEVERRLARSAPRANKGSWRRLARAAEGSLRALSRAAEGSLRALSRAAEGSLRALSRAAEGSRRWLGYAAAAVVVAAIGGAFVMRGPAPPIAATLDDDTTIRRLVAESQRLERDLAPHRSGPRFAVDPDGSRSMQWAASREALFYRLADIDDELTVQSLAPSANPERMAELWRQRVELMQSLGELERAQQWQAYRTVVF